MFLLRDGPMILMYFESLIVLVRSWSSFSHYTDVIKCGVICDVIIIIEREGGLEVFFDPLSKDFSEFTSILCITSLPVILVSINHPTC